MVLPYRPKPKQDELFSSWLVRVANGYGLGLNDFLAVTGLAKYVGSADCDRLACTELVESLARLTGTTPERARQSLLSTHIVALTRGCVQIDSATPWLLPVGRSRRDYPPKGFQLCPKCISEDVPHLKWHWCIALYSCCLKHGCYLIDQCPRCKNNIHPYRLGLLGMRRLPGAERLIRIELCDECRYDLRAACSLTTPSGRILDQQLMHHEAMVSGRAGQKDSSEYFGVLRHIVELLFGPNRGLESFRAVVEQASGVGRVDIGPAYLPDLENPSFEDMEAEIRARILEAAAWLLDDWPIRFIDCGRKARVAYPTLNRNAVSVRWYNEAVAEAYAEAGTKRSGVKKRA